MWMQMPGKKSSIEEVPEKRVRDEPEPEPEPEDYEEIIIVEAEAAENGYHQQQEEAQEVVRVVSKEKTREFVRKEMMKLVQTLDELIEFDDHAFVVNFVLDMTGQAKKKFWEIQGLP